jgi:Tfp pilus assembly protein PilX
MREARVADRQTSDTRDLLIRLEAARAALEDAEAELQKRTATTLSRCPG